MEILFGPRKKYNCFFELCLWITEELAMAETPISISATSFILHKAIKVQA